jgi:hypothetical protein
MNITIAAENLSDPSMSAKGRLRSEALQSRNDRSWLDPATGGRQAVRPLSWSKPTFEPNVSS